MTTTTATRTTVNTNLVPSDDEYAAFRSLTEKLLAVPKAEIDAARKRD